LLKVVAKRLMHLMTSSLPLLMSNMDGKKNRE